MLLPCVPQGARRQAAEEKQGSKQEPQMYILRSMYLSIKKYIYRERRKRAGRVEFLRGKRKRESVAPGKGGGRGRRVGMMLVGGNFRESCFCFLPYLVVGPMARP